MSSGAYQPGISILICSRDRRQDLKRITDDLKSMRTRHEFEIVVVEETDNPYPIEGVTYIPHPVKNFGFPYARNLSVAGSTGGIIVFVDDDCRINNGWLDNLLRPFEDASVMGVQGGVTVPGDTNAIGWVESILGFPGGGIGRIIKARGEQRSTIEISTLNCAYRRSVIEAVGGFDHRLKTGGEDYLLAKKTCSVGKCVFAPDAVVEHRARGSLREIWRWFLRRGRAEIGVVHTGEYAEANWFSVLRGSLTVKFGLFSSLCLALSMRWLITIPAFFLLYSLVQYLRNHSVWKKSNAPLRSLLLLPLVKFIMDAAMDAGRLRGIFHD